jgi:hypothetical protein
MNLRLDRRNPADHIYALIAVDFPTNRRIRQPRWNKLGKQVTSMRLTKNTTTERIAFSAQAVFRDTQWIVPEK